MRVDPYRLVLLTLAGAVLGALPAAALKPSEILGKNWAAECTKEGGKKHACCKAKADKCLADCGASQTNAATQCRNQCDAAWRVCKKNMAMVRPFGDAAAPVRPGAATDPTPPAGSSRPGARGVRPGAAEPGPVLSPPKPRAPGDRLVCCKVVKLQSGWTAYEWKPAAECGHDPIDGISRTVVSGRLCAVASPE